MNEQKKDIVITGDPRIVAGFLKKLVNKQFPVPVYPEKETEDRAGLFDLSVAISILEKAEPRTLTITDGESKADKIWREDTK